MSQAPSLGLLFLSGCIVLSRAGSLRARAGAALLALAVAVLALGGSAPAGAQTGSGGGQAQQLQGQITEASTAEVQALAALEATRGQEAELNARVSGLQAQMAVAQAKLDPLQADADRITAEYGAVQAAEQATQAQLDAAQHALNASAGSLLVSAEAGDGFESIQASPPQDLTAGEQYLHWVTQVRKSLVLRVRTLRDTLENERRAVAGAKAQADAIAGQARAARDQIAALVAQLQPAQAQAAQAQVVDEQQLASIVARKGEFQLQLSSLAGTSDSIATLLRRSTLPGSVALCDDRPVPGPIISPFGPRVDPITGAQGFHPGVDLQATYGTPIHACRAGVVLIASAQGGYGNAVVIDDGGGMGNLYAHQSRIAVHVGDHVNAGDVIGYVGSTGYSTGPHLHFEVRLSGNPVDPAPFLPL
jgi:murein DD-endopeptidase MepM/ murein hydrolase activator NlpD